MKQEPPGDSLSSLGGSFVLRSSNELGERTVMTDNAYWIARWEKGDIGWHQAEVERELIAAWSGVAPTRVFVPLCGKSLDLVWLASQGHEVVGVEASAQACEEFFRENNIPFQRTNFGPFQKLEGPRITILHGDFFDLRPEHVGAISRVYDRGALIALPSEVRRRYVPVIKSLLDSARVAKPEILQLVIERTPSDSEGPPFSLTEAELRSLYEPEYSIRLLKTEFLEKDEAKGTEKFQKVYAVKRV